MRRSVAPAPTRSSRSLPVERWPEADRNAWKTACQPPTRLKRGGAAGHLKSVTRDDHAAHYGNFLGFLNRNRLLALRGPAAAVTPEKVKAYIDELRDRVASTTLHGAICRVRRAAQYMAPGRDFTWLAEIDLDKNSPIQAGCGKSACPVR